MRLRPPVLLEILRPHNMLAAALGALAGYFAAGGRAWEGVVATAVLTALATGAGNVINDCFDLAIDRVNKPARPLPSGRVSVRAAFRLYAVLSAVIAPAAILLLPGAVAALVLAWQAALFVYARWCKRWFIAGNVLVAAISSSAFLAGAMTAGEASAGWVPAGIAFAFVMCREIVKGGEDVEGDRASGVRTLAVRAGTARAGHAAAALMLALAVLLPLPALAGFYRAAYLALMGGVVVPTLVLGALAVAGATERRVYARTSRALKLAMFVGIAAIAAGS
jgi:geranylgeranylglycerol-phosphate geranylgeranyltransferase